MAVNPSIQLGTSGNWAIKEDNLLAYKQLGNKFFDREFDFSRGTTATFVGRNGFIQESGLNGTEIVTNGDFATDSDWSKTNATISNGLATITVTNGGYSAINQSITYATGKEYIITAQVQGLSGSSGKQIKFQDRGNNTGGLNIANGLITLDETLQNIEISWTANSNSDIIVISRSSNSGDYSFTIDNVSIKEIQLDVPRIDFTDDPTGHLLLEPQSTNLLTYSEDFNQWSKLNGGTGSLPIVTSNNSTSPDGTQNADKIIFNKGNATSNSDYSLIRLDYGGSDINGTSSVYLKSDVNINIEISSDDISYKTISVTTNWNRFEVSDATSDRLSMGLRGTEPSNSSATIYAWGAQLEQNSFSTSYIPTEGSIKTRLADAAFGSGSSDLINSTEGVLYAEIASLTDFSGSISINDATVSNRIELGFTSSSRAIIYMEVGGVLQVYERPAVSDITSFYKIAFKWKLNDFSLHINGNKVATSSNGVTPSANTFNNLSFNGFYSNNFFGKTKCIAVFKEALTDEELECLTTI